MGLLQDDFEYNRIPYSSLISLITFAFRFQANIDYPILETDMLTVDAGISVRLEKIVYSRSLDFKANTHS